MGNRNILKYIILASLALAVLGYQNCAPISGGANGDPYEGFTDPDSTSGGENFRLPTIVPVNESDPTPVPNLGGVGPEDVLQTVNCESTNPNSHVESVDVSKNITAEVGTLRLRIREGGEILVFDLNYDYLPTNNWPINLRITDSVFGINFSHSANSALITIESNGSADQSELLTCQALN